MHNPMALPATLKHFTHPQHILVREVSDRNLGEGYQNGEFICDACNTLGCGDRYHCRKCDFDLHDECAATCPPGYIKSYLHPNHKLSLVWEGSELIKKGYGVFRPCNVCRDQVNGLFYKCSSGESCFFVHPLCSKFPSQVPHVIDRNHPLKFQSVPIIPDSGCTICGDLVCASSWSYRCDPCGIKIHSECVTLPYSGATGSSRSSREPHQQMHQERSPVPHGGNTGKADQAHRYNYHPSSHNHNYHPSSHNHNYPPVPLPHYLNYYPPGPLPHYLNYYPPHASPHQGTASSSGGGKKRRTYVIVGRIAMSLVSTAALGVPLFV